MTKGGTNMKAPYKEADGINMTILELIEECTRLDNLLPNYNIQS